MCNLSLTHRSENGLPPPPVPISWLSIELETSAYAPPPRSRCLHSISPPRMKIMLTKVTKMYATEVMAVTDSDSNSSLTFAEPGIALCFCSWYREASWFGPFLLPVPPLLVAAPPKGEGTAVKSTSGIANSSAGTDGAFQPDGWLVVGSQDGSALSRVFAVPPPPPPKVPPPKSARHKLSNKLAKSEA